jgi:hypothetical protein
MSQFEEDSLRQISDFLITIRSLVLFRRKKTRLFLMFRLERALFSSIAQWGLIYKKSPQVNNSCRRACFFNPNSG